MEADEFLLLDWMSWPSLLTLLEVNPAYIPRQVHKNLITVVPYNKQNNQGHHHSLSNLQGIQLKPQIIPIVLTIFSLKFKFHFFPPGITSVKIQHQKGLLKGD